ncbi:16S rRNA (cytidine(1402)-2'-O)-methyltransferase [Alphaproteobacteria bacterium]|nr:16S rRNA (cytidine(1402)-2'-O)-methyltransferase [Alphaproteobacteria bacterium]
MSEHSNEKDSTWLLPDCKNQNLPAGLYMVATPIGNLSDITVRALEVLSRADLVVCEDKRVTGKLLKAYGLSKPLRVYNDHSEVDDREWILKRIRAGELVAFVSDAGMPMISDPGYKLVRACVDHGFHVSSLPGANAPLMALQLSGLPSDKFSFLGFLPNKSVARRQYLVGLKNVPITLVMFESAARLEKTLFDIAEVLGERRVAVVREMTKLHEEVRRGAAAKLADYYSENGAPKGEIVLVVEGAVQSQGVDGETLRFALKEALSDMRTKDASRFVSDRFGLSNKDVYALALEIKGEE